MSFRASILVVLAFITGCPRPEASDAADQTPHTDESPAVVEEGTDSPAEPTPDTAPPVAEDTAEEPVVEAPTELCGDGIDNDGDALIDEEGVGAVSVFVDGDGDGIGDLSWPTLACPGAPFTSVQVGDCDDTRPDVFPGAPEVWYDGVDQDCDPDTEYDADGDGQALLGSVGYRPTDCDDAAASVFLGAEEIWYDGIDQDCNPFTEYDRDNDGAPGGGEALTLDCDDADPGVGVPTLFFADLDGDGFGDDAATASACAAPAGFVALPGDCDDGRADAHPGAAELPWDGVDQACDGGDDYDVDGDGFRHPLAGDAAADCDDLAPSTHPGAAEIWYDGVDQDCDPQTEWDRDGDGLRASGTPDAGEGDCDDANAGVAGPQTWYVDDDGDGFGGSGSLRLCSMPAGYTATPGDCDDAAAATWPGAEDAWYDGVDANCVGDDDFDQDRDGFGAGATPDCDDLNAAIWPGAAEVWYDGVDQDCDPSTEYDQDGDGVDTLGIDGDCDDLDPAVGLPDAYFADRDADGFGDAESPRAACAQPVGFVRGARDCDDRDPMANPRGTEVCGGGDEDCDGATDEGVGSLWYADADADGHGDRDGAPTQACTQPAGHVALADDCDDAAAAVNPAGAEVCGGGDEDCDGQIDEQVGSWWYPDHDSDNHGDDNEPAFQACVRPAYTASVAGDCDDTRADVHEDAQETCDGVDNDCDVRTMMDPENTCPFGVQRFDYEGSAYMANMYLGPTTYQIAAEACAAFGYHLFVPETDAEATDVRVGVRQWDEAVWLGVADCGSTYGLYLHGEDACGELDDDLVFTHNLVDDFQDLINSHPDAAFFMRAQSTRWRESTVTQNDTYNVICEIELR